MFQDARRNESGFADTAGTVEVRATNLEHAPHERVVAVGHKVVAALIVRVVGVVLVPLLQGHVLHASCAAVLKVSDVPAQQGTPEGRIRELASGERVEREIVILEQQWGRGSRGDSSCSCCLFARRCDQGF
jgi:hypothetical protein